MLSSSNSSSRTAHGHSIGTQSYKIITQFGDMLVVKQGIQHNQQQQQQQQQDSGCQSYQTRPIIMTFHDLGLNSELQFATFCECEEVKLMLQTFTMIHVNFIGQEFGRAGKGGGMDNTLGEDFKYPSVEQLAESIVDICTQLRVRSFIALAVGAGAHIVSSLALMRPDLIDGLFLINPVVASCSITEWLYFKMSAITSNQHLNPSGQRSDSANEHSSSSSFRHNHHNNHSNSNSSHLMDPCSSTTGSPRQAAAEQQHGFKRIFNAAAHINSPTSTSSLATATEQQNQPEKLSSMVQEVDNQILKQPVKSSDRAGDQASLHSSQSSLASNSRTSHSQSGSRLRRLILSKNFRLGGGGGGGAHSTAATRRREVERAEMATRTSSSDSINVSPNSQRSNSKRPPIEYLMYHHFGPTSFQRYRRSSDTPPPAVQPSTSGDSGEQASLNSQHSSPMSGRRIGAAAGGRTMPATPVSAGGGSGKCSRSHESLVQATRNRSGSVCLSTSHLASLSSERQRATYMQSVYRHYFSQINAHNLWQFAHSFAKRRTLNLRKDCGAAAHAAAAAAALGTSICTAFLSATPAQTKQVDSSSSSWSVGGEHNDYHQSGSSALLTHTSNLSNRETFTIQTSASATTTTTETNEQLNKGTNAKRPSGKQQAVVAGTKVKRTFTCQTLIMCSSVQMHCERAFKLMSLLNPLQATWIKTDNLLVLEERPEKVCQALRLFLQGIGYSMSTYERRLRLNSAHGSASSAESNSSASRSLSEKG